jgi:hypothetical protein
MPIKHKKMTVEEHNEIGKKLKAIMKLQDDVYKEVVTAFGKTSRPAIFLRRFMGKVDDVRTELDSELARVTTREEWDQNGYSGIYY